MKTKTCGECKYRYAYRHDEDCNGRCKLAPTYRIPSDKPACSDFEPIPPPTNGDVVRQGNNRKLAEIFDDLYNGNKCKYCIHYAGSGVCILNPTTFSEYDEGYLDDEDCLNGFEAWLNAPAEINTEREGER